MSTNLALRHIANLWEVSLAPEVIARTLEQYRATGEHARDVGSYDGIAFQFYIKYHARLPQQVYDTLSDETLSDLLQFETEAALESFESEAHAQYSWIESVSTAGRSGGWLMIVPKNASLLSNIVDYRDTWLTEVRDGAIPPEDLEYASDVARGLIDLDAKVRSELQNFVRVLESPDFWQSYLEEEPPQHTASETYFDSTPDVGDQPEDRTFVNPLDDKKLRRTNPKRFDIRHDQYESHENGIQDTDVSNRYDNAPPKASSLVTTAVVEMDILEKLEQLDWEVDQTVQAAQLATIVKTTAKPSVTFEAAKPEDMEALAALQQLAFAQYPAQPPNYFAEPNIMRRADYVVARDVATNKIVGGFVSRWSPAKKTNEMVQILVSPEYQGMGLGRDMMQHFENLHPEARRFTLNTPDFAEGNHRFYQNLGYEATSRQPSGGAKSFDLVNYQKERENEEAKLTARLLQRVHFAGLLDRIRGRHRHHHGDRIAFAEFPPAVRDFITQNFAGVFERHPEAQKAVGELYIEFMARPKRHPDFPDVPYRETIGGEYFPEEHKIGFFLKPSSLNDYWYGIVHEIAHAVQVALAGKDSEVPPPPDKTKREYYADEGAYRKDPGEQHAYATQEAFLRYLEGVQ